VALARLTAGSQVETILRSRSHYEIGFLHDQGFRAEVAERLGHGEEIRVVERVPVGLCVVDRRTSLLSLNPAAVASGPGTWIVLEHQGLAVLTGHDRLPTVRVFCCTAGSARQPRGILRKTDRTARAGRPPGGGARMTTQPADGSDLIDRLVRYGLGHGEARCRPGDDQDPVDLLRRQDQVLDGRDRAMRAAEHEVLAVAAMPWKPPAFPARLRPGVRLRAVHERAAFAGGPPAGDAQPESLLIRHAGLAEVLHEAFERLWERGQPPGEAGGVRTDQAGETAPGDDRQVRFPRPG
jgi:hypothetical protein